MQHKQMLVLLNLIKACHDATSLYPSAHPALARQYANFAKTFGRLLGTQEQLSIMFEGGLILANGRTLPREFSKALAARWLMAQCQDRRIFQIILLRGLRSSDVGGLTALFRRGYKEFTDYDSAAEFLARDKVAYIQINPVSMDQTFSNLPAFGALPNIQPTEASKSESSAKHGGDEESGDGAIPLADSAEAPISVRLFISEEDRSILFNSMVQFIRQNRLKKVAEALNLMHKDLLDAEREVRELAFSSYHGVVLGLIKEKQNKPLFSILKSLLPDFQACGEIDLYEIHLDTLSRLVRYFRDTGQLAALMYGLNILAHEARLRKGEIGTMLEKKITSLLDPRQMEALLRSKDPKVESLLQALWGRNGMGVVKPMLNALFETSNRTMRERLLQKLHKLGPGAFPRFVMELRIALQKERPWYIKRNLLTLLAKKPPPALAPLLDNLLKAPQKKLLELAQRCAFLIEDPIAHEQAKRLLRKAVGRQLAQLLDYAAAGGQDAYAAELSAILDREVSDQLKIEAVQALGKLDGPASVNSLLGILEKPGRLSGVSRQELRVTAARALAAGKRPEALAGMTLLARDKDKLVRAIAKRALARAGLSD